MPRRSRRNQPEGVMNHTKGSSKEDRTAFQGTTDFSTTLHQPGQDPTIGQVQAHHIVSKKRTFPSQEASSTDPAPKTTRKAQPTKKARKRGATDISDGREVAGAGNETEGLHSCVAEGTDMHQPLRQTSSFYPGRGNTGNTLPTSKLYLDNELDTNSDVSSEADWLDEPDLDEAPRQASKFSEALAIERPSWHVSSAPSNSTSTVVHPNNQLQANNANTSQEGSGSSLTDTPKSEFSWPADTDLQFPVGSKRLMLTGQNPKVHCVVQDAMEIVRAELLFRCAYPDLTYTVVTIRNSLVEAAGRYPKTAIIRRRLLFEEEYMTKIIPLIRARIPLFRSEVKGRCADIVSTEMLSIGSADEIKSNVARQLSTYNYTYLLTKGFTRPPLRSKPYRNNQIISVIQDLYFTGGVTAFANRFLDLFPTHQTTDGPTREAPVAMVALAATSLYAALHKWSTGIHQPVEFSASAYLDVYNGHILSLTRIEEERNHAFHVMMKDIYSQARAASTLISGAQIAEIDLEELDD